jgi:hypothetical protein
MQETITANKLVITDTLISRKGTPLKLSSVERNPRGCSGNVHAHIQNGGTLCFYGGSEVKVIRKGYVHPGDENEPQKPETD